MKWTNPGNQLDSLGAKYLEVKNLYIYGNDDQARKAYECLCWLGVADDFAISFVQDITVYVAESDHTFCGKSVIPFQTVLCDELRKDPNKAAVILPWIAQTNERAALEEIGVTNIFYLLASHNRRDNFIQNFLCIWLMYKHNKLLSHSTNFVTTLRCNLNCKCCLNFNNNITDPKNVSFETFKEHLDTVFQKFDYLYSFHLCGGEPLVVKELPRFIRYIEENYKDKVFEFFIITNGTILPSEELIAATKSMNGRFLVDDYSATVANTKVEEIQRILAAHDVECRINKVDRWFDLDIENTDNCDMSEIDLERHKDSCNSYLQEFADGRIFACCYSIYANRAGIAASTDGDQLNDYIEIASSSKMELLEYRQGYTQKGYVDMCKHCKGIGTDAIFVPAAVQQPKIATFRNQDTAATDNKHDTLVSICVPIYNTAKYLARCISSLLNQTFPNIEVVLVDDGSSDGSEQICDDFAHADDRVRVVHKENGGEASARNTGLNTATGNYVVFIDSDDEYLPDAVRLMVEAMKANDADLVIGGYLERSGDVEHFATGHQRRYSTKEIANAYLSESCQYSMPYIASTVNAKLFQRALLVENNIAFDEHFVIGNDSVFMCEYLKHVNVVYDVLSPVYIYYKFQPEERIQGMNWYYPDAFFLFAYVADRMIKLAQPDATEYKRLVAKEYKNFLYALTNAAVNEELFKNGIMPYFESILNEIELVQIGAGLDMSENLIAHEQGALPIRLLSYLIVEKRYDELWKLLKSLGKERGLLPYSGKRARQMIKLKDTASASQPCAEPEHSAVLAEQLNLLNDSLVEKQQQIKTLEERIHILETQNNEATFEVAQLEEQNSSLLNSKSWKLTKPLRTLKNSLTKKM